MKIEVENYIKAKMKRALVRGKQAQEAYQEEEMRAAANLYADAMNLYYQCASDLIDGTGFKEAEGETK